MGPSSLSSSKWAWILLATVVAVTWMSFSSGLIFLNKHIMSEGGLNFHYPMCLSGLGMFFSSFASFAACRIFSVFEAKQQVTLKFYVARILPVGLFMAMTLAFGNLVYIYLTVAFIQMLKAFTPVITMFMAFVAGVETASTRLVGAVVLIAAGVALASYGEVNFQLLGVLFMFASEFTESLRLIMTQLLLQGCKFSAIEGLMYLAPACTFWLGIGSYLMEFDAMLAEGAFETIAAKPTVFISAACMGFMVNLFAYLTIQLAGSLSLKVLGTVKNALVVWGGVILFGDIVSGLSLAGYGISIFGFFIYNHVKMQAMQAPTESKSSAKVDEEAAAHEKVPLKGKA